MPSAHFSARWALAAVCVAALLIGRVGTTAAQENGSFYAAGTDATGDEATLEIHKAECYTGVGPDIYEACHANAVAGVAFSVNGAVGVTDAEGYLSFHGPPTTVTVAEDPAVFSLYLGAYVYCRDFVDDEVLYDDSATDTGGVVTIAVSAGDRVVCDWYDIYAADGGDDASDDGDEVGGVTGLPNTGAGPATLAPGRGGPLALLVAGGVLAAIAVGRRRRPA